VLDLNATAARAHIGKRLRLAAQLERGAREEVDRLSSIAAEMGWTNAEIAHVTGEKPGTIRERRRKGWFRQRQGRRPADSPPKRPRKEHL